VKAVIEYTQAAFKLTTPFSAAAYNHHKNSFANKKLPKLIASQSF
jgi:hypothetical protein